MVVVNAAAALLLSAAMVGAMPCDNPTLKPTPVCDETLPAQKRAEALVSLLQNSEKPNLLVNTAQGVGRLGIDSYQWWSEALHGVASSAGVHFVQPTPCATMFPQVGLTASSFNKTLWAAIGQAISTEARAMNNAGNAGLTYWAPNINIFRDPRWGRGQETPGEDPYLTAVYAEQFVRNMQEGEDPNHLKTSSCCKHYYAYDLENSDGVDRYHFDAVINKRDEAETYLPAFQSCVANAKASSIMCSYNAVNGVPSCANSRIMTDIARGRWGFEGYITSDCGAVNGVWSAHHYADLLHTCTATLEAGMDSDCGTYLSQNLPQAMAQNITSQAVVDQALRHLFQVQIRLGMFDSPAEQPYMRYNYSTKANTPAHQELALDAARQGIVLLKHAAGGLPWSNSTIKKVAIVGPNAGPSAPDTMKGNYYGVPPYMISPEQGLSAYVQTTFYPGCSSTACTNPNGFSQAAAAAQAADATVIMVGINKYQEAEALDRTEIGLPGQQNALIELVANASRGPVVVVVMAGGPLDLSVPKNHPKVQSMLWIGYPGQSGGQAMAEVIFGDYNPSGRLVTTQYPKDYISKLQMTDMSFRPNSTTSNPGRTYRFLTTEPVYPFGYGLSYTTFNYSGQSSVVVHKSDLNAEVKRVNDHDDYVANSSTKTLATVTVVVANTGEVAGDEVVLAYSVPPNPGKDGAPLKFLVAFDRVSLQPGSTAHVELHLTAFSLSLVDEDGNRYSTAGDWTVHVGDIVVSVNFQ